ncbi:AAA family ATPase [Ponticoccus sp. SC2-23]|uniref:AAA family ATPase n=1 Tax=Alexandriicola marinus TaxID=2081710 RepID=UPI0013DF6B55|nr:AAA family ATPase [Alexandriicola marinus]MBM1222469.1 AAA family ATPase [Ponticoccus sp. SC6-9]MBM1226975.1 AAA family ATPase [Ponticoccus sp. SC6-15]MBM1231396.1 AAA family ATPase [Ponticoccus sp. SC6-38]MBM1235969.1 AAA family ATPase [Ponticoccus sp. SC6-45]MBM1240419.1 AAA family ATPase [Ponticoccus sp. SC6-49]MBM1244954.1 AAA family ATPase [Ponticoccus sp. SC2-64]MBM1249443.1 AAA family ATPase [Ponticoccus sp. SC6-42]MBM1253912.1 AAA family ATPase [Ponticoccus sp. SC6-33]MBM1258426
MAQASDPPYFGISPDEAEAELDIPTSTDGFAEIARACAAGRDDLASRGLEENGQRQLRLFSTWEITRYLIPVAPAHFRRVLKGNPELPQGRSETDGGAKWFTLDEVLRLRAHFAAEGSKAKNYLPYRPKGLPAKTVAVANFKGGVGKTSTAAQLAMSAALDGYRVLVIDLDSQGSMTSIFGGKVADEWQTVFPLLARHYAGHLQAENRRRMERGEGPITLDDTLTEALRLRSKDLIQGTHWPNIDLIGAQLNLYWAEFQVPVWRMQGRGWKLWDALTDILSEDGILDAYDLVILDTPPALGYLTINGLAAADILLVPTGASFLEFDSTGRFFDMLHTTFRSIEEGENLAARALGRPEMAFQWDAVRAVVTRYDGSQQAELAGLMQAYLGRTLSPHRQDFTALIGQAGEQVQGIYEADYRDFNRETYARGRETFDATYAAFKRLLYGAWRRDERLAREAAE